MFDEARDTISMFLLVGKTRILVCHLLMYTMSIDPAVIASFKLDRNLFFHEYNHRLAMLEFLVSKVAMMLTLGMFSTGM